MGSPTRDQMAEVLQLTYAAYPPDRFGVFDAMADAIMVMLAEATAGCSHEDTGYCRVADAAAEAREVARGEAVVLRERLAHLEQELARGGITREKMRQQLADAKRAAEAQQETSDLRWLVGHLLANHPAPHTIPWPPRLRTLAVRCQQSYDAGRFTVANVTPSPAAAPQPRVLPEEHEYVSTACWHAARTGDEDDHERCRLACKYCAMPCRCECHYRGEEPPAVHGDTENPA